MGLKMTLLKHLSEYWYLYLFILLSLLLGYIIILYALNVYEPYNLINCTYGSIIIPNQTYCGTKNEIIINFSFHEII